MGRAYLSLPISEWRVWWNEWGREKELSEHNDSAVYHQAVVIRWLRLLCAVCCYYRLNDFLTFRCFSPSLCVRMYVCFVPAAYTVNETR